MSGGVEKKRVVITGLGVIAPNANGVEDFEAALRAGRSGIKHQESMVEAKFGCTVAGSPEGVDALCEDTFSEEELLAMNMNHRYASLAAIEAWQDAGLERPAHDSEHVDWASGAILGTGIDRPRATKTLHACFCCADEALAASTGDADADAAVLRAAIETSGLLREGQMIDQIVVDCGIDLLAE